MIITREDVCEFRGLMVALRVYIERDLSTYDMGISTRKIPSDISSVHYSILISSCSTIKLRTRQGLYKDLHGEGSLSIETLSTTS
jgi:hypothetical protein